MYILLAISVLSLTIIFVARLESASCGCDPTGRSQGYGKKPCAMAM